MSTISQATAQVPAEAKDRLITVMRDRDGDLLSALKDAIACVGAKEYVKISGINRRSVARMLAQNDVPKIDTLNRYLAPFGLKVKIQVEDAA